MVDRSLVVVKGKNRIEWQKQTRMAKTGKRGKAGKQGKNRKKSQNQARIK